MNKSFLVLFVLLQSLPVHAMVYTWTDSAGVAHYTNKDYEVPSRYRAKAKSLYPEQGDTGVLQQNVETQQLTTVPPSLAPVQQTKPEEPAKPLHPEMAPAPQKIIPPGSAAGKVKHRRRGPVE